jgi:hypothetical protein
MDTYTKYYITIIAGSCRKPKIAIATGCNREPEAITGGWCRVLYIVVTTYHYGGLYISFIMTYFRQRYLANIVGWDGWIFFCHYNGLIFKALYCIYNGLLWRRP